MASLAFLRLIIQPVTVSASYSSVLLEVLGAFPAALALRCQS